MAKLRILLELDLSKIKPSDFYGAIENIPGNGDERVNFIKSWNPDEVKAAAPPPEQAAPIKTLGDFKKPGRYNGNRRTKDKPAHDVFNYVLGDLKPHTIEQLNKELQEVGYKLSSCGSLLSKAVREKCVRYVHNNHVQLLKACDADTFRDDANKKKLKLAVAVGGGA